MAQCLLLSYINLAHVISVYAKSLGRGIIMICWEIVIRKLIQGKINKSLPYSSSFQNPLPGRIYWSQISLFFSKKSKS